MSGPPPVAADLLARSTLEVARGLLGWHLVRDDGEPDGPGGGGEGRDPRGRRVARIVEVEAYIGEDDRASHARFGRTGRNEVMYGPPGRAYVYLVYGMHDCLNIVTGPAGSPAALLVRAVEPLAGVDAMRAAAERRAAERRRVAPRPGIAAGRARTPDHRLGSGPGLVCAIFGIDRALTGHDLFDPAAAIRVEPPPAGEPRPAIATGPRVGIGYAEAPWNSVPWRFAIAGNRSVSRPALPDPAGPDDARRRPRPGRALEPGA